MTVRFISLIRQNQQQLLVHQQQQSSSSLFSLLFCSSHTRITTTTKTNLPVYKSFRQLTLVSTTTKPTSASVVPIQQGGIIVSTICTTHYLKYDNYSHNYQHQNNNNNNNNNNLTLSTTATTLTIRRISSKTTASSNNDTTTSTSTESTTVLIESLINKINKQQLISATDNDSNNNTKNNTTININAYDIFDIPYTFTINEIHIKEKYHLYMKLLHPDKLRKQQHSNININDIDKIPNIINAAYDILKNKVSRALLLLQINGYPLDDESTNSTTIVGLDFLQSVLQYREDIDTILINYADDTDTTNTNQKQIELQQIQTIIQNHIDSTCTKLSVLLDNNPTTTTSNDDDTTTTNKKEESIRLVAQLQYYNRIYETIKLHLD